MPSLDGFHLPREQPSPSDLEDDDLLIRAVHESKFIAGFHQLVARHHSRQLATYVYAIDRKSVPSHGQQPPSAEGQPRSPQHGKPRTMTMGLWEDQLRTAGPAVGVLSWTGGYALSG